MLRDLRKNGGATKLRNRNKFSTTQQRLKREFTIPWRIELFGFLAVPVLNGGTGGRGGHKVATMLRILRNRIARQ